MSPAEFKVSRGPRFSINSFCKKEKSVRCGIGGPNMAYRRRVGAGSVPGRHCRGSFGVLRYSTSHSADPQSSVALNFGCRRRGRASSGVPARGPWCTGRESLSPSGTELGQKPRRYKDSYSLNQVITTSFSTRSYCIYVFASAQGHQIQPRDGRNNGFPSPLSPGATGAGTTRSVLPALPEHAIIHRRHVRHHPFFPITPPDLDPPPPRPRRAHPPA